MVYDYRKEMKEDITDYIVSGGVDKEDLEGTFEDVYERLYDYMWADDLITGNGSDFGYTEGDSYKAEEYICHNLELLGDALYEFGVDDNPLKKGAIYCDTTIRCYLLSEILIEVLEEMGYEY